MKKCAPFRGHLKGVIIVFVAGFLAATGHAQSCTPTPPGLVDWWRAEGNAVDSIGTNHGTVVGTVGFVPGEVGQAFSFDGSGGYISVPDSPGLDSFATNITVELWMKSGTLTTYSNYETLVAKGSFTAWQIEGTFLKNSITVLVGGLYTVLTGGRNVNDGQWHHVAVTYNGSSLALYVDGTLDVSQAASGALWVDNIDPLTIGNSPQDNYVFTGLIDEVSLYNRALSPGEIAAIYSAGTAGKCFIPQLPAVVSQPTNQSLVAGQSTSFSVAASGSPVLTYQWFHGSGSISGATNSTLNVNYVQLGDGGAYYVVVSNPYGSTNSLTATLTVTNPPPPPPSCTPALSGLAAWWRAEGDARDSAGANNGTISGQVSFTNGEVGQAFLFGGTISDSTSTYISVPASSSLDVGAGEGLTIEGWIWPHNPGWIVEWQGGNVGLWFSGRTLSAYLDDTYNDFHLLQSALDTISTNGWQHVAETYDKSSGNAYLYINGVQVANTNLGMIQPMTSVPLYLGASWNNGFGLMDEVSLYNRALRPNEIQAIYNAGSAGKCFGPVPPSMVSGPADQTTAAGASAGFTVVAAGAPPLTYQWFNGNGSISGATNRTLNLNHVQFSDAGSYYVVVGNFYGSTNSSVATLAVTNPLNCLAPPGGMVGWWRAEGNAMDSAGTNNGTITGGASFFTNGEAGEAFLFNGTNGYVSIPASPNLNVGAGNGMTIECWIWPSQPGPIVEWNNSSNYYSNTEGTKLWFQSQGTLYGDLMGEGGNTYRLQSAPGTIGTNGWQHVAETYDRASGYAYLYINGVPVTSRNFGNITPLTSYPLELGGVQGWVFPGNNSLYGGLLDEVSIYNRALSPGEIQAIYSAGKCSGPTPPSIVSGPTNLTVAAGGRASFSVLAAGSPPLTYQWFNSSGSISGATADPTFNLDTVYFSNADSYYVVVSNAYGWTNSAPAALTVTNPPPSVCTPVPSGIIGWWRAESDATDFVGPNNGIVLGGLSFTNGEVGQGFWFNGTNQGVRIPSSTSLGTGNTRTFECWINPTDVSQSHPILDWGGLEVSIESRGVLKARLITYEIGRPPIENDFYSGPELVISNAFQHVAINFINNFNESTGERNGEVYLYYDGVLAGSVVGPQTTVSFGPSGDLYLGDSPTEGTDFAGIIDEASLYQSTAPFNPYSASPPALTGDQIAAIYNAGPGGKCLPPPVILSQPTNEVVNAGGIAFFRVLVAAGGGSDSYQWQLNGTNLAGRNLNSLQLQNVSAADAGNYSVVITGVNTHVSITSSVVSLTVVSPPVINGLVQNVDGSFSLNLVTTTNINSRVYSATDLTPPIFWQPIYTNPNGGVWQFTDTNMGGVACKYYRVSTP